MRTRKDTDRTNILTVEDFLNKKDLIEDFLRKHVQEVCPPIKVRYNDWPALERQIREEMGSLDEFYGKCCHVAHFVLFLLGGKSEGHKLRISKPKVFHTLKDGTELKTTHWWLKTKCGELVDLSASQFDQFNIDMDMFYSTEVGQDVGFPYYKVSGPKWTYYNENVPTRKVLELGRRFKEEFGTAYGLDWWMDELTALEKRDITERDIKDKEDRIRTRKIKNERKQKRQETRN